MHCEVVSNIFFSPSFFGFNGISSKNQDSPSIEEGDKGLKSSLSQITDKSVGVVKDLFFVIGTFFSRLTHRNNYGSEVDFTGNSDVFCGFFHGLNQHPSQVDAFRDQMDQGLKDKNVTYYQPFIKNKGNCSLDEAANEIYDNISTWAEKNPGKPIILSGASNGARISAFVASRLKVDKKISNPVLVNAVVGPFGGTTMMNHPSWSERAKKYWNLFIQSPFAGRHCKEVIEELSSESDLSKEIMVKIKTAAKDEGVKFHFFATSGDCIVTPYTSALPQEIVNAEYHTKHYQGHCSIIKLVSSEISTISLSWLSERK